MENKKIKAVSYARVSSEEQKKHGFSIAAQTDLLNDYAEKYNFEIVKEFSEAETAKDTGRHKFKEMVQYLKKNKDVKTILVEKTDRLYRNFYDYVDLDVDKTGYTVCLVKEGVVLSPTSSSHEKFVHGMKVLLAKNFIDNLRDETQKGRLRKVKEGYFIGHVPYGYLKLNDKKTTLLDPQTSKFVKRAFELYAEGNISLKSLRQRLYNEGFVYTMSHPKISTGQLGKLLQNDCYIGFIRHRGKVYEGKHPHIVSKQLFMKAQRAFKKDGKPDTRVGHHFLYKGMIKCAECGCAVTSEIKKGKWIYYHCTGNAKEPCTQKKQYIKQEDIDLQIDEAIKNVVIDDRLADYINMLLEKSYKEMQIATRGQYDYLQTEIKKYNTRKEKLLETYLDGYIDKEEWLCNTQKIDNQIDLFKDKLNLISMSDKEFIDEGKNIIECSRKAFELYQKQTTEEKRRLLDVMFEQIKLKGRNIEYTYKKPFCYFAKCNLENVDEIVNFINSHIKK